mgnify:CR=1 FL=1
MPLSKRQKRRLLEVSKMIESSIAVKDDMEEIQLEYAQELEDLANTFQQKKVSNKEPTSRDIVPSVTGEKKISKAAQKAAERRSKQRKKESQTPPPARTPDIVNNSPEWAKRLWKQIAKKCHPDRLSFQELTAIEISRRQTWFLEAKKLFEDQEWPKLVHIGVQLGEYVEDIDAKQQLGWLNREYEGISKTIISVQDSLAWKWGTNWENLELRHKIVVAILRHKGITPPPKPEIIQVLLKLELD